MKSYLKGPDVSASSVPCTVMVRLQVRVFPAASAAVYWTRVSPAGNREPGLWLLVTVRRPPEREEHSTDNRKSVSALVSPAQVGILKAVFVTLCKVQSLFCSHVSYSGCTAEGSLGLTPCSRSE